jgi:hypothetical protein
MAGSSEAINYSIRPNKSVERRLLVDALALLPDTLNLSAYRYIGLGGMWFTDFVLFHRILRINDMISMESDDPERASFNIPLSCIRVIPGESNELLKEGTIPLIDKELLVWMDYDGTATPTVLFDLEQFCLQAKKGSIVIATVNAYKRSYLQMDETVLDDPKNLSLAESLSYLGDLVPNPLPNNADTQGGFGKLLATMLLNHMGRVILKGRKDLTFLPLFNFAYADRAPMVTVGGAICDAQLNNEIRSSQCFGLEFIGKTGQSSISVPPLTYREKLAFDCLLPELDEAFESSFYEKLKFKLPPAQIDDYRRYYRYYPVYWESA